MKRSGDIFVNIAKGCQYSILESFKVITLIIKNIYRKNEKKKFAILKNGI